MSNVLEHIPMRRVEYTNILATLTPFLEALEEGGVPYRPTLAKAGLPTEIDDPLQEVEVRRLMRFVHQIAYDEGLPQLGMLASLRGPERVLHPRILSGIRNSPSLLTALRAVCGLVHLQGRGLRVWLDLRPHQLRVCHATLSSSTQPGAEHFEIVRTVRLVTIIERFLGRGWRPSRVDFVMPRLKDPLFLEWLRDGEVRTGAPCGMIPIPIERLGDDVTSGGGDARVHGHTRSGDSSWDLRLELLEATVTSRLFHEVPTIEVAADMLDCRVRTLQRRLAEAGTTYREFLAHLRFREGRRLLRHSDMTIREVAHRVGYTDASNFARAFRRISGISPEEIRRQA